MVDFKKVETKWQKKWEKEKVFEADIDNKKKKFFITIPYPYLNGRPHIGAGFTFTRGDVYARFKRMQGFNVLFPQGFHATGEPILGTVERLKKGDKAQIETFKMYGATDKDLKDFVAKGPEVVARFWMKGFIKDFKSMGYSIDWRRTFVTAITPTYNRFIEWQYNTLRKKGYVTQGTHPVIWCPHDKSPTGDHDRLKGEGESPIEFTVVKFTLDSGEVIPCATLRPETMYGATNLWIKPDLEYFWSQVGSERWLLSKEAAEKLKDQLKDVKVGEKIKGEKLVGKYVENPIAKSKISILPADFVDPSVGTGVVVSVPSHAPYDWAALVDLKNNQKELKKYHIEIVVDKVKPIAMINVEGFWEHPAIELYEKMGIKSQNDTEKLDKATNLLYKKEHHTGIMKENTGEYSGSKVSEIKEKLIKDFMNKNFADRIWETTGVVVCRCTNRCHVKILENQWFLKFSDGMWKERVKQCIGQMKFYPEEARIQFLNTVDWLDDKACARKAGLGTRLPWDKDWIVETLSDSVIYMAYYTISRILNEKKVSAENLTDDVFDFIFLGKGNPKSKLGKTILQRMRDEFEYFYPFDLRNSAKDLVQNHLTYALFHHVAIWDSTHWPRAYGVNGFVNVSGEKMAKSKGNIIPLKDLIKQHGADLVRINIVSSNENMDDADWKEDSLKTFFSRLAFLEQLVKNYKKAKRKSTNNLDRYIQSVLQNSIKGATENYEVMKFRSGIQYSVFQSLNELQYYIERCGGIENCNKVVLKDCISIVLELIGPFTPHLSEELWSNLGNKNFISLGPWPASDEKKIDKNILELENIFKKTQEDVKQILKLAGDKKNLYLYFVTDKEFAYFKESADYLQKLFGFKKLQLFKASDKNKYDPQNKASKAKYGKPGIFLE